MIWMLVPAAQAFCGSFVSSSEGPLYNAASAVALVREGTRTTLTMANDYEGDPEEFALVVPVPVVLGEEDVHIVDPAIFDNLAAYSAPRLVSYTCEELYPDPAPRQQVFEPGSLGCAEYAMSSPGAFESDSGYGGTEVEAQFIVGEYEVVVLSADEASGMLNWLGDNGYVVDATTGELLQEYLDGGSYFFAAKVFITRLPAGQDRLSPLQFSYESEAFGLPIRLGTANSPGAQDLIVYAVTPVADGRVGIANYPEAEVESLCLVREPEAFGSLYEERFAEAVEGDEAHWTTEYGWEVINTAVKCDPCPEGVNPVAPIPAADMATLGFGLDGSQDTGGWWYTTPEFYFTRLHMRYTPEQATEDLSLYTSGIRDNTQQRYVVHERYLESEWPICGEGWADDPGSCADVDPKYERRIRASHAEADGGCSSLAGRRSLALLFAGLLTLLVRSRRS